jgi:hypothetical protein
MPSFSTHVAISGSVSAIAASYLAAIGHIPAENAVYFVAAGIAGGMLPDLDADNGVPVRIAGIAASLLVFHLALNTGVNIEYVPDIISFTVPFVLSALVYFAGVRAFKMWSVHRGVLHSLLFVACAWSVVSFFYGEVYAHFVAINALIHLIADEVYSLFNGKKSLGTALKFAGNRLFDNVFLLVVTLVFLNFSEVKQWLNQYLL